MPQFETLIRAVIPHERTDANLVAYLEWHEREFVVSLIERTILVSLVRY